MTAANLTAPTMPDASSTFQSMVNLFGTAGTYALDVIGAAVGLGIIVIVALYVWRLLKKWLQTSK